MTYPKTKEENGRISCPECSKTFSDRSGFRYHWRKHNKVETNSIKEIGEMVIKSLEKRERLFPKDFKVKKGDLKPEVWNLLFSDLHYGQIVRGSEVGELAEYNTEIAKERVFTLAKKIVRFLEYYPNKPDELVITFLGDNADGSILRGNQQSNIEFGICRQSIEVVEIMSDFILFLSGYFKKIRCYGVYGNHTRLTQNPKDSAPSDNFDLLIYHFVKERLSGLKGITFEYTEAQHMIVEIAKHNFWIEHGDTVRGWAGFPSYGLSRQKANIQEMLGLTDNKADYFMCGHFHQSYKAGNIHINGAFVGGDLYSIGRLRKMGMPSQTLFGVQENYGIVWERDIQLMKLKKGGVKIYK